MEKAIPELRPNDIMLKTNMRDVTKVTGIESNKKLYRIFSSN